MTPPPLVFSPYLEDAMYSVSKTFTFEAAHRLLKHGGKCARLHGHSYKATVTIPSTKLDDNGMVIDFADLHTVIGRWIADNLDHNIILNPNDPMLRVQKLFGDHMSDEDCEKWITTEMFRGKPPFIMPRDKAEPTAENIAALIWVEASRRLRELFPPQFLALTVEVQETENCRASFGGLFQ
jgi:queuosine biosynthesis protein QueD